MKIGAGIFLFRSTTWKPMENVIATMLLNTGTNCEIAVVDLTKYFLGESKLIVFPHCSVTSVYTIPICCKLDLLYHADQIAFYFSIRKAFMIDVNSFF